MNNDLEQFSEERLKDMQKHVTAGMTLGHADALLIRQAIDIALAAKQAKPTAWRVGGYLSNNKEWAEKASAEENYLLEPLYNHPLITGIDENHCEPELEPGLYVAEIMTKGGAACINGKFITPQPAHTEHDGWRLVPEEATIAMLTLLGMTGSFEFMQQKYKNMLAAAPKPESE